MLMRGRIRSSQPGSHQLRSPRISYAARMSDQSYAERFDVLRGMPSEGRPHQSILEDLRGIATEEDAFWETGKCSGTMYCGDHDHYAFMNDVFALFSHTNILQRDMFPIATKF